MSEQTPQPEIPSILDRAELIYDALAMNGYLTLSEIIAITGIPRSSAHRLLGKMVQLRWLLRVGDSYELGVRLFELGSEGLRTHWFHRIAYPRLCELQKRTGVVVHMAYLDGDQAVFWEKLGTGGFGAELPTRIGGRWPAHTVALGKVLLAAEPDELLDGPAFRDLKPSTPATITDPAALRAEIARVRSDGVAFDRGESLRGVGCIAAPVHAGDANTSDGRTTTAAISVCAPLNQIDRRFVALLRTSAAEISRTAGLNPMATP